MELIKHDISPIIEDAKSLFRKDVLSKRIKSTDNIKAGKYLMKIDNVNKISKDIVLH